MTERIKDGQLRSWDDFFETGRFKIPSDMDKLSTRLGTNFHYYFLNYLVLNNVLVLATILMYARIWYLLIFAAIHFIIKFAYNGEEEKRFANELLIKIPMHAILLYFAVGEFARATVILMSFLILLIHGSCRCRSTKSKFLYMKSQASNKFE